MDIQVNRTKNEDNELIFTIVVKNPHHASFGEVESHIMALLDACKEDVYLTTSEENRTKQDVINLIHAAKEKTFMRILDNLKFSIENEFRPKFQPICQEIYNWIYDNQTDVLKSWMSDFNPLRTRYYFDNDNHPNKFKSIQESEHDGEEDDNEDDDE